MQFNVKFFASLAERTGLTDITLDAHQLTTVADVWDRATDHQSRPANTLCSINLVHARFEDHVHDGDEIAFFPPVTGG
ncbi:MAG: MoaD/ThiS family protein [Gammaproteobacteria bacterium]|nr:MoaD/ThiS family protein [Gammaproteobacteria bacterium]